MNITDPRANGPSSASKATVFHTRQKASDDKTLLTPENLKKQKVRALRLLLSYAFAVKHHLRGEEGTEWPDYQDVLPAGFTRFDQIGFDRTANTSYSSIGMPNKDATLGRTAASGRVKMSDSQTIVTTPTTPLLTDSHQTVEFHPYADSLSLPLPMVYGRASTCIP